MTVDLSEVIAALAVLAALGLAFLLVAWAWRVARRAAETARAVREGVDEVMRHLAEEGWEPPSGRGSD